MERQNSGNQVSGGELAQMINAGFKDVKEDIGQVKGRFDILEERFDGLEGRFDIMDARLGRIEADISNLREEVV